MAYTDKPSVVAQAVYDLWNANKATLALEGVWYGNQQLNPKTPSVCVEPGNYTRELQGAQNATINHFTVESLIYVAKIDDNQVNLKKSEELAEAMMELIHQDLNLGGLVYYGFVTAITPGVVRKGNSLMRATRLTWEGDSKTRL